MLYSQSLDSIFFAETCLHEGCPDRLLDPEDSYNMLRHDRIDGHVSGVCIFISKHFTFVPVIMSKAIVI